MVDLSMATDFMTTHARLLDRRRFELLLGGATGEEALAALAGYANADGGFGWGIEPDLRSPTSQPVSALHAFEVFEEVAPLTSPLAPALCDWLDSATLADGGLPFATQGADAVGSAPFFASGDPTASSLHMTACVAGIAHRVARNDPSVRDHPWLSRATAYCLERIAEIQEVSHAYELRFVLDLLDAIAESDSEAAAQLERLAGFIPASGALPVSGGVEGETLRPLYVSPRPDRPLRRAMPAAAIDGDLDRLEAEQKPDGGWDVDYQTWSPAAALEWRGYITVWAMQTLMANGRGDQRARLATSSSDSVL